MIKYIVEVSFHKIPPKDRMTQKTFNLVFNPKSSGWWMNRNTRVTELSDSFEERKDALKTLKDIVPAGCKVDVDNETISCSNYPEYLENMIARIKEKQSDPMPIVSKENPYMFKDVLFVGYFFGWEILSLYKLMFYITGNFPINNNGSAAFHIGGIFELNNRF